MAHVTCSTAIESYVIKSAYLQRQVIVDFYVPHLHEGDPAPHLLLINDGQDLIKMPFEQVLAELDSTQETDPLFCVGIHCGADRKNEYGVVGKTDYAGRGSRAGEYEKFIFNELLPFIRKKKGALNFASAGFAGFSLGGLTALDLVWRNPDTFHTAGIFSGSLWWRSVAQEAPHFDEEKHRIIHNQIKKGKFFPGLKFFFETGTLDETADRNNNGIIDSIDDTLALISDLKAKGYQDSDIAYLELKDGRHDVATWARAFPYFLKWAYPARK